MGFFTINYDEPDSNTYKGIKLHLDDGIKNFNTGKLDKDYYNYLKFLNKINYNLPISYSSSWDHFWMDGGDKSYTIKYIKNDKLINS